jgi:hypothetical protein
MRNPFVMMALAVAASVARFQSQVLSGESMVLARPTKYARKNGLTAAASKRAAVKRRNILRHRAACRG